jgi:hypothetical protein
MVMFLLTFQAMVYLISVQLIHEKIQLLMLGNTICCRSESEETYVITS